MRIAILSFDGFNELDSFVPLALLNRLAHLGWKAEIAAPATSITSMNGVTVQAQQPLEFANEADAVIFGSGLYARAIAQDSRVLGRLQLDPLRQRIAGQCSGVLLMARLGLLGILPACTDASTKPWVVATGALVLDEPFHAKGPIATAGGCLASQYLSAWLMASAAGMDAATEALRQAAPVGEKDTYVQRLLAVVAPFLPEAGEGTG